MSVPNSFAAVTSATGAQLDANFAATVQLNAVNNLTGVINDAPPITLASATTVNIGGAASSNIIISGTTSIAAFDTVQAGAIRVVTYSGAVPIQYNAVSMSLVGGANRVNAAGDVSIFQSLGSGNWDEISYMPAAGYLTGAQTAVAPFFVKQFFPTF